MKIDSLPILLAWGMEAASSQCNGEIQRTARQRRSLRRRWHAQIKIWIYF